MRAAVLSTVFIVTLAIILPTAVYSITGPNCKKKCDAGATGYFQLCSRCDKYMACVHGHKWRMSCPAGLVWDQNLQRCGYTSSTCNSDATTPPPPTTTTPPTTTKANPPPMPGNWGLWDDWSDCTEDCGGGTQEKSRICDNPAPQGGGDDCQGRSYESRACNTFACPECSRTCPPGCTISTTVCGICEDSTSVTGKVTDCTTGNPLANVEVFAGNNLLEPLAETDVTGNFLLTNMCGGDLELYFDKYGYTSEQVSYMFSGSSLVIKMCANYITFTEHPESVAMFTGGDLTLTCQATGLPDVTHYDWFKDFNVISFGDEVAGDGSAFTITGLAESDNGFYQCRAVSSAMKKFSKSAEVIVRADGEDTCAEEPLPDMLYLESGCTADVDGEEVTAFDIGVCAGSTCSFKDGSDSTGMCCEMKTSDIITVNCNTFSYTISRILTCGCGECSDAVDVEVSGYAKFVNTDDPNTHISPNKQISFYVGSNIYWTAEDGYFKQVVTAVDDRIVLQFRGGFAENYIPNIATILLENGKNSYETLVLLQILPDPIELDPTVENVLTFGTSGGLSPMATLTIPANSMTLENGQLLDGSITVLAYPTFDDPRLDDGLALAPGEFTTADSDGVLQNLETGGVLGLQMFVAGTGQIVILPGNVEFDLDLSQSAGGLSTWRMDQGQGNWDDPTPVGGGSGRRKKRQTGDGSSSTSFPSDGPVRKINYDRVDASRRCYVRVYVFRDANCTIPAANIPVCIYTKDFDGTNTVSKTTGYTDSTGAACVFVPCDRQHEVLLNSQFEYQTSDTHNLPALFPFTNHPSNKRVIFTSSLITDASVVSGDGPVYNSPTACRDQSQQDYHFKFFFTNYPKPGKLTPTEPQPGLPNSWYPEPATSPAREACMVRVRVDSFDNGLDTIATSYRGDDASGFNYGIYETGFLKYYVQHLANYQAGRNFACVEVKCPGEPLDNETIPTTTNDPAVFVEVNINHPNVSACRFVRWGYDNGLVLEPMSQTDSSFTFLLDNGNCQSCDPDSENYNYEDCYWQYNEGQSDRDVRGSCYDGQLFIGHGEGRKARNNAFQQCMSSYAPYVARFDCSGGMVAENYWETVTPSPPSNATTAATVP